MCRQAIPPGTAGFPETAFYNFRMNNVGNKTDVGLSMPMPKAVVATITSPSSRNNLWWFNSRVVGNMPAC
jgi:hypothetical protein